VGIDDLAFSPEGARLVAASDGGVAAKVWGLDAGIPAEILLIPTVDTYGDVAFTADSRHVVAADDSGRLRAWDLADGSASPAFGPGVGQHSFDLSPDGRTLAMPLYLNGVGAWDVASGRQVWRLGDVGWVDEVAWSPDGQHLIASVHEPMAVTLVLDRQGRVVTELAEERSSYAALRSDRSHGGRRRLPGRRRWGHAVRLAATGDPAAHTVAASGHHRHRP
jgi:hypothetical protein